MPSDPAALVRALRACRYAMIEASRHLTIGSPVYKAAHAVTQAIDGLTTLLTGDSEYFWENGGGATEAQRLKMADRAARERGEKPWQP